MAWDRRLLSRSQHLCLLISGFRGNYPAIGPDGMLSPMAQQSGTALNFKVGLTPRYKPGQEFAKEAVRTFGLIIDDTEDKLRIQAEKATALESFDYDNETDTSGEPASQGETTIEEDEGRFDRFSLSSSLESLLDHALLKVLQIRRQFGLRWAGAEVLFGEVERTQMKAEDIYNRHRQVSSSFTFSSVCRIELALVGDYCSRQSGSRVRSNQSSSTRSSFGSGGIR